MVASGDRGRITNEVTSDTLSDLKYEFLNRARAVLNQFLLGLAQFLLVGFLACCPLCICSSPRAAYF